MKDLTHYFGQSPPGDGASSLKENNSNPSKSSAKTNNLKSASSPEVLKSKTPCNNVSIDPPTQSSKSKSVSAETKEPLKEKSFPKKKSSLRVKTLSISCSASEEVKSHKKRGKKPSSKQSDESKVSATDEDHQESVSKGEEEESIHVEVISPVARSLDQFFISKKETAIFSPTSDGSEAEAKLNLPKNIMHFFSPPKCSKEQSETNPADETQEVHGKATTQNLESTLPTTLKREQGQKAGVLKNRRKAAKLRDSDDSTEVPDKITASQPKLFKPKLSLSRAGHTEGSKQPVTKNEKVEMSAESSSKAESQDVKLNISNAFQTLMSKKQGTDIQPESAHQEADTLSYTSLNVKTSSSSDPRTKSTPPPRKKRKRVLSECDEDSQNKEGDQQKKGAIEEVEGEASNSQNDFNRKNLMNYFQKVSKEEAAIQLQKNEFEVKAQVHYSDAPDETKIKRVPGSQSKTLKKKKAKSKRNEDDIEWLSSEFISVETPSSKASSSSIKKNKEDCSAEDSTPSKKRNVKTERSLKPESKSVRSSPRAKKTATPSEDVACDQKLASADTPSESSATLKPSSIHLTKVPTKALKQSTLKSCSVSSTSKSLNEAEETQNSPLKKNSLSSVIVLKKLSLSANSEAPKMSPKRKSSPAKFYQAENRSPVRRKGKTLSKAKSSKSSKLSTKKTQGDLDVSAGESQDSVLFCVSDGEVKSPRKDAQQLFLNSPDSPTELEERSSSPLSRGWKLRVSLTPRSDSAKRKAPETKPTCVTPATGPDDEADGEKVAVVKTKKAKRAERVTDHPPESEEVKILCEVKDLTSSPKRTKKLAPLFVRNKKLDRAAELAKQEFLLSGVPEQVKKNMEAQKSMECIEVELFPAISHVQQRDSSFPWNLTVVDLPLKSGSGPQDENPVPSRPLLLGDVSACDTIGYDLAQVLTNRSAPPVSLKRRIAMEHVAPLLRLIRDEDPDFEVVRTFTTIREKYRKFLDSGASSEISKGKRRSRSSRRSRGSLQGSPATKTAPKAPCLMWTDKYRPTSCEDIVGNKESVQQLKQWLEDRRRVPQSGQIAAPKPKKSRKNADDFIVYEESCDSSSSSASLPNSALLLGPNGSGKTCTVYALAADLGYKVLEINASERRNGKIILSKLSEATQSHHVVSRPFDQSSAFANLFNLQDKPKSAKPKAGKRKLPKKPEIGAEGDSSKSKLSLILVKDVDVVFEEEDEGFVSAVATLVSTSKRPVIFTTTEADFPHLKRVINSSTILLQFTPDLKSLSTWLQVLSLVEGVFVSRNAISDLLSACNSDIRQCLLQLQIWVSTGGNCSAAAQHKIDGNEKNDASLLQEFLQGDVKTEDLDCDFGASLLTVHKHQDCVGALQGRNDIKWETTNDNVSISIPTPLNFGRLWWNIPRLLSLAQFQPSPSEIPEAAQVPRRFKRIFDDSLFDMDSDDEGSRDAAQPQPGDSKEANDAEPANGEKPVAVDTPEDAEDNASAPAAPVAPATPATPACRQEEIDAVLQHMLAMSTCDLLATASGLPETNDDVEPTPKYWQNQPRASLSQTVPIVEGPNLHMEELSRTVCHWLSECSINATRKILQGDQQPPRFDLLPDQHIRRRRLDVADAERAVLESVSMSVQLERTSVALDYLPTLKRICNLEQKRLALNSTRRNRFYHYFKGIGISLSSQQTLVLGYS